MYNEYIINKNLHLCKWTAYKRTNFAFTKINSYSLKMSRLLLYTISFLVGCHFYCKAQCNNSLIRIPAITAANECGTEALQEAAKTSTRNVLSLYYPSSSMNMPDTIRPVLITDNYGCTQGLIWDDNILSHQPTIVGIHHVNISYENQINSIQVTYLLAGGTLYNAPRRGSSIGYSTSIALNEDERFIRIEGMESSSGVTQLIFISKNSSGIERMHGPFGGTGGTPFSIEGYILGFRGYASSSVHGLSAYYLSPLIKSNETFGGSVRTYPFDDNVDAIIPPVVGIKSITVYHGGFVDSIQCTYIRYGGSIFEGEQHGGPGGGRTTVTLKENEVLYRLIAKTSGGTYLSQLTLYSIRQQNSRMHGPFGGFFSGNSYEFSGNILGFYGYLEDYSAGTAVSRIGVYTV